MQKRYSADELRMNYWEWCKTLTAAEKKRFLVWDDFVEFFINKNMTGPFFKGDIIQDLTVFRTISLSLIEVFEGLYIDPTFQKDLAYKFANKVTVPTKGDALRYLRITDSEEPKGGMWITNFVTSPDEIECKWLGKADRYYYIWFEVILEIGSYEHVREELTLRLTPWEIQTIYTYFLENKRKIRTLKTAEEVNFIHAVLQEIVG